LKKEIVLSLSFPEGVEAAADKKKKRLPVIVDALDKDAKAQPFGHGQNQESNVGPLKGDVNIQGDPSSGCAVIDTSNGFTSTHI